MMALAELLDLPAYALVLLGAVLQRPDLTLLAIVLAFAAVALATADRLTS